MTVLIGCTIHINFLISPTVASFTIAIPRVIKIMTAPIPAPYITKAAMEALGEPSVKVIPVTDKKIGRVQLSEAIP
ncbi:uncharacterized protein METZ01_LOCUS111769 [marine metagenome]|uniref:Uncharacterized protein n=1 Tax=marine metagenome TaxID=408172 RepID=A0A381X2G4_9ZZZZ